MAVVLEDVMVKTVIVEDGTVFVETATYAIQDGLRLPNAVQFKRTSFIPGSDVDKLHPKAQAHATIAWTPEVIQAYQDKQAAIAEARGKT